MIDALTEKCVRALIDEDRPITAKEIANEIGMSVSSVKHNMGYVRQLIDENGGQLETLPGRGFKLHLDDDGREQLIQMINENRDKSYYFSYRKSYILNILFENNSNYTIQIFADDLNVGKNIINRDLDRIEQWLDYFDLKLNRTRNRGITVEGGEFQKRQALIYDNAMRLNDLIPGNDKPEIIDYRISQRMYTYFRTLYPQCDVAELQDQVLLIEERLNMIFDDTSFTQLMEYIAITKTRIHKNCIVVEPNIMYKCKITMDQYNVAHDIIDRLANDMHFFSLLEVRCLAAQIAIYSSRASGLSMIHEAYYNDIAERFIELLQRIIQNKNILISESLIEDLSSLFMKKKLQRSYQVTNDSYLNFDIKSSMPGLYGIVLTNLQPVENRLRITMTENDVAYITMMISNAIEGAKAELKIIVYNSFDRNTRTYIKNKLYHSLDNVKKVEMVREDNFQNVNLSNYDLVFTTTPCPVENAIKVSRRLDRFDIKKMNDTILNRIKESQKIKINNTQIFFLENIKTGYSAKNKEDVIRKGCKLLEETGFVQPGFEQKVLDRENVTPTSIGGGVAIPHGFRENVKQSAVAVITLKHAIDWSKNDKVQVVFLIAADFKNNQEIQDFFSKFYAFIDDKNSIQEVIDARLPTHILEILHRKNLY